MNNQYDSERNPQAMDGTDRALCLNAGERRNKIARRLLGLLLAIMVMACSESADEKNSLLPDNQIHPTTAMTWPEWVAYETPKREGLKTVDDFSSYPLGKGIPNYSQWHAQDLLPAEVLGHEHRDLCEADITQSQRNTLRQFSYFFPSGPSHTGFDINRLLALAEQGYPEAQSTLGAFCDADMEQRVSHYDKDKDGAILYDDDGKISRDNKGNIRYDNGWETLVLPKAKRKVRVQDALYWAQRGAASGNAIAQSGLAWCMYNIYLRNESQSEWRQAARKTDQPRDKIEIDAFWFDKIAYWREQSLQNGLLDKALKDHTLEATLAASEPRKIIEEYKWSRLWEIQVHFRKKRFAYYRYGDYFPQYDDDGHYQKKGEEGEEGEEGESAYDLFSTNNLKQHLDAKAVVQAEKEVGEWLRAHPDVWHNIYQHTYFQQRGVAPYLCPGEQGDDAGVSKDETHYEQFDFEWLNKELAQYQLKVAVPKPVLPPIIPTPPDSNRP